MTSTLGDLLRSAKKRHGGASGRGLAEIAQRDGYDIDRTQINAILNDTYPHTPRRPVLEAIAHLAGVSVREAYRAAGQPVPGRRFSEEIPDNADILTAGQRAVVLGVIREMVSMELIMQKHLAVAHPGWEDLADTIGLQQSPVPHVGLGSIDLLTETDDPVGAREMVAASKRQMRRFRDGILENRDRRAADPTVTEIPRRRDPTSSLYEPIAAYETGEPTDAELREQHEAEAEEAAVAEERRRQDESDGA